MALELESVAVGAGASERVLIAVELAAVRAAASLAVSASLTGLGLFGLLWRRRR